jgi:hypothetical protein
VGCHTDAYEQAKWFGDDLAVKADGFLVADPGPARMLSRLGAGKPPLERARLGAEFVGALRRGAVIDLTSHWLAADGLARRLGLGDDVRQSLRESYERWDGKGAVGAKGRRSGSPSRLVSLADVVAVFHRLGGLDASVAVARERSGTAFDPALVDLFCSRAAELLGDLESASNWDELIAAEPPLELLVSEERLDRRLGQARGTDSGGDRTGPPASLPDRAHARVLACAGRPGSDRGAAP